MKLVSRNEVQLNSRSVQDCVKLEQTYAISPISYYFKSFRAASSTHVESAQCVFIFDQSAHAHTFGEWTCQEGFQRLFTYLKILLEGE